MTKNPIVFDLIIQEKKTTDYLASKNISNIPKCLYLGKIQNNLLYIQSTKKAYSSRVINKMTNEHLLFLKEIYEKTKVRCKYEDSDYYVTIKKFKKYLEEIDILRRINDKDGVLLRVQKYVSNLEFFSFYHSDFTPWNSFFNNKEIFVFDFEYSKQLYPPFLDFFHFLIQTKIFEKKYNSKQIVDFIFYKFKSELLMFSNPSISLLCYLIDCLVLYLDKGYSLLSITDKKLLNYWIEMINYISIQ